MNNKILLKIEPLQLFTYLLRLISIAAIGFCIYKFNVNPLVFTLFAALSLVLFLITRTSRIILTNEYLLIEHRNILPFMSHVKKIPIGDISQIGFNKEYKPLSRHLLPDAHLYPTHNNELLLKLTNGEEICQSQIGSTKEFLKLLGILVEKVNLQEGN